MLLFIVLGDISLYIVLDFDLPRSWGDSQAVSITYPQVANNIS